MYFENKIVKLIVVFYLHETCKVTQYQPTNVSHSMLILFLYKSQKLTQE